MITINYDCMMSHQAARARTLGAIVYCVGVKDFNETQVMMTMIFVDVFKGLFVLH